jgi:pSer/pThr/pTyr-binding forkhead associated (FHA) protein
MPRFQLLIREVGKAPRTVPLTQTLIVGRSRRADVVIDDEEVSREQCRVGVDGALVFVEGIGTTNRTSVDGTGVAAGRRVTVAAGASIKIGRTVLQVQLGDATTGTMPPPQPLDATLIAPPPGRSAHDPAAGATSPPPSPPQSAPGRGDAARDATLPPGATTRPPTPGRPAAPRAPAPAPEPDFGQTMNMPGAFRPGAGAPPPSPPPSADAPLDAPGVTMNFGAYRPGRGAAPPDLPPAASPPPPAPGAPSATRPPAPPLPPAAAARPPASSTPPPAIAPPPGAALPPAAPPPAPAATGDAPVRPKTVFLAADDVPPPSNITPAIAAAVEPLLHQAMPRLFVKGETLRRRVRLMKARTRVGRAETADVLLPHESVSELHAEIEFDGTTWSLRDCGSTNGTFVDGALLRGQAAPIARHSLLGFGTLRGIFLCNDAATAAADRRAEERALRLLVATGRLGKSVAREVAALARRDPALTIAEILLGDTAIEPADWANAIGEVRLRGTLLDRLRALFGGRPRPKAR